MYENWKILKSEADEKAEEYSQVAEWCNNGGEYHIELYIDENDVEWYRVVKNPEPLPPTKEEQEQNRAYAYQQEVDIITSHIQRLRDMEQTEEIIAEINQLMIERDIKVQEIKERFPYPVNNSENLNYNNAELTL
jgi:hypothetical protein